MIKNKHLCLFSIFDLVHTNNKIKKNKEQRIKYKKIMAKSILERHFNIKINNPEKIDKDAKIIISNHSFFWDILVIEYLYNERLIWIAKKELYKNKFIKPLLENDSILIDRNDKNSLIHIVKQIKNLIKNENFLNNSNKIVIFPEGTRNRENGKMLKWKPGISIITKKFEKLKIQPITLKYLKNKKILEINILDSFYYYKNWEKDCYDKMNNSIIKN